MSIINDQEIRESDLLKAIINNRDAKIKYTVQTALCDIYDLIKQREELLSCFKEIISKMCEDKNKEILEKFLKSHLDRAQMNNFILSHFYDFSDINFNQQYWKN